MNEPEHDDVVRPAAHSCQLFDKVPVLALDHVTVMELPLLAREAGVGEPDGPPSRN